jgi:hypothetical protein
MKLTTLSTSTALFTLLGVANASGSHAAHAKHARQVAAAAGSSVASGTSTGVASAATGTTAATGTGAPSSVATGAATGTTSVAAATGPASGAGAVTGSPTFTTSPPVLTTTLFTSGESMRPLSEISYGMASQSSLPITATYSAGQAAKISGAPPLPTPCTFSFFFFLPRVVWSGADGPRLIVVVNVADWPAMDKVPPTGMSPALYY